MDWKYQILVQFPNADLTQRARVVELERSIETSLGPSLSAEVAGHGWGPDEINVIVFGDRPDAICARIQDLAQAHESRDFKLAYREIDGGDWTLVWPAGPASIGEPDLDWGYRLIVVFPLRKADGSTFLERVRGVASLISGRLGDGPEAVFDGHYVTANETSIEILTDDPEATFRRLRPVLDEHAPRADFHVAYARARGGDRTHLYRASPTSTPPEPIDDRDEGETSLRFQLVIQFSAEDGDIAAFDRLTHLEERIDAVLTDDANDVVDGHDYGSGEMNIFILTNTPAETFARIRGIVDEQGPKAQFRAAYRDLDEDEFTILWPAGLETFDVA